MRVGHERYGEALDGAPALIARQVFDTLVSWREGSTDIEPDAVRFDPLLQRLNNDTEPGATAEEGATAPETPPAVDGELTEDQAIDRVAARPEVKAWMKQVHDREPNNKTMVRSVGLEMGRYTIHVYEDVNDGNGLGHSATFGWYEVDKKTGEVVKSEE